MERDDQLAELFARWKSSVQEGRPSTPEELCCDCPELLTEFRELLPQLMMVEAMFDDADDPLLPNDWADVVVTDHLRTRSFHKAGGLGVILLGEDLELRRRVAIKCLKAEFDREGEPRHRFLREAEITARLEHPGVVPIYRLGHTPQGRPFYAMRFIQGETLAEAVERFHQTLDTRGRTLERNLEFRRLVRALITVGETVAYAHSRGVIHRDLKPENIMLGVRRGACT